MSPAVLKLMVLFVSVCVFEILVPGFVFLFWCDTTVSILTQHGPRGVSRYPKHSSDPGSVSMSGFEPKCMTRLLLGDLHVLEFYLNIFSRSNRSMIVTVYWRDCFEQIIIFYIISRINTQIVIAHLLLLDKNLIGTNQMNY